MGDAASQDAETLQLLGLAEGALGPAAVSDVLRQEDGPDEAAVLAAQGRSVPVAQDPLARAGEALGGEPAAGLGPEQGLALIGHLGLVFLRDEQAGILAQDVLPGVAEDPLRRGVPLAHPEGRVGLDHRQGRGG